MYHQTKFNCELPWSDQTKWKKGFWYPVPVENNYFDGLSDSAPSSWDIHMLDDDAPEWDEYACSMPWDFDMDLSMRQAITICEAHNKEKLFERTNT